MDQPSRIPILYMLYDRGIATGRGRAVKVDFEKLEGTADDADMLHGYHHPCLGGPRQMLKSIIRSKVLAVRSAAVLSCGATCSLSWTSQQSNGRTPGFSMYCVLQLILLPDSFRSACFAVMTDAPPSLRQVKIIKKVQTWVYVFIHSTCSI